METARPALERIEPQPDNYCFGCGGANPIGMKLAFELDHGRRRSRGRFQFGPELQGGNRTLHGGIIAVVLDEAMGKLTRLAGVRAVTAELQIEYLRPIPVNEPIEVGAEEVRRDGRNLHYQAEIRNRDGKPLARGRARFVAITER
jgi:uncharacterized protein (TIGR00369 family)